MFKFTCLVYGNIIYIFLLHFLRLHHLWIPLTATFYIVAQLSLHGLEALQPRIPMNLLRGSWIWLRFDMFDIFLSAINFENGYHSVMTLTYPYWDGFACMEFILNFQSTQVLYWSQISWSSFLEHILFRGDSFTSFVRFNHNIMLFIHYTWLHVMLKSPC